jgi:hypothetical protein
MFLTPPQWCELPHDIRAKLATFFKLKRTGTNHLEDNVLVEDGYSGEELMKLDIPFLQNFTQSKATTFPTLIKKALEKIDDLISSPNPHVQTNQGATSQESSPAGTEASTNPRGDSKGNAPSTYV